MLEPIDLQILRINKVVVEKALDLAEKRLADVLTTKDAIERKLSLLATAYISISIAAIGLTQSQSASQVAAALALAIAFVLLIAIIYLLPSLKGKSYGAAGCDPKLWLRLGLIDADPDDEAPLTSKLAYLLVEFQERIDQSMESNRKKMSVLDNSLAMGKWAVVVAVIGGFIAFSYRLYH